MAEAVRPNALGRASRGATADRTAVKAAARTVEPRRPLHLAVAIGLSAGAYAAALAGVTALQATSVRDLNAANQPASDMADRLAAEHDRLGDRLTQAAAAYDRAASAYDDATASLDGLEQRLHKLAVQVKAVEGSAAWVPPPVSPLRAVSRSARAAPAAPASNGSSGASGH